MNVSIELLPHLAPENMGSRSRTGSPRGATSISASLIENVVARLRENKRIRRTLPGAGRLHIDRQVPFLCVYRQVDEPPGLEMSHLVTSEAAYVYVNELITGVASLQKLITSVGQVLVDEFGAFLLLEIWQGRFHSNEDPSGPAIKPPAFRLVLSPNDPLDDLVDDFVKSLARIKIDGQNSTVDVSFRRVTAPNDRRPLLAYASRKRLNCSLLGLEVLPMFWDPKSGQIYPKVRRQLERQLTIALKRVFFDFARRHTTHRPPHYHSLGRRAMSKTVWRADQLLAEFSDKFDFVLQVSPINVIEAWRIFQRGRYRRVPRFYYRPLPIDPVLLKRELYRVPVERIEDPAINELFREKQLELDWQIGMLDQINSRHFLLGSVQLYGNVEPPLMKCAQAILERFPKGKREVSKRLDASEFAILARNEIAYLRQLGNRVEAEVEVRDDVSGLVVSRGNLLVGSDVRIPQVRADALLQHEIGTHVLTYFNGLAQPFQLLRTGLSGYAPLQEGIAVLAEFLVGGLDRNRLRLLAARVIAVSMKIDGASFLECFHTLVDQYRFTKRTAFGVTTRAYRGGGLTKDAIYLRGLLQTLSHLGNGGQLETLLIGKISSGHVSLVKELRWRKVLHEPRLTPRYLQNEDALRRLAWVRQGITIENLVDACE